MLQVKKAVTSSVPQGQIFIDSDIFKQYMLSSSCDLCSVGRQIDSNAVRFLFLPTRLSEFCFNFGWHWLLSRPHNWCLDKSLMGRKHTGDTINCCLWCQITAVWPLQPQLSRRLPKSKGNGLWFKQPVWIPTISLLSFSLQPQSVVRGNYHAITLLFTRPLYEEGQPFVLALLEKHH